MTTTTSDHPTSPRRPLPRPLRLLAAGALLLLLLAALTLALTEHHIEVDINSGREARSLAVGRFTYSRRPYDTPLSRLLADAGWRPPPPVWRRVHTPRTLGNARIHYRYGDIVTSAHHVTRYLEVLSPSIPPADQHRLALATIGCLQRGEKFYVLADFKAPEIQLTSETGEVIESYPAN